MLGRWWWKRGRLRMTTFEPHSTQAARHGISDSHVISMQCPVQYDKTRPLNGVGPPQYLTRFESRWTVYCRSGTQAEFNIRRWQSIVGTLKTLRLSHEHLGRATPPSLPRCMLQPCLFPILTTCLRVCFRMPRSPNAIEDKGGNSSTSTPPFELPNPARRTLRIGSEFRNASYYFRISPMHLSFRKQQS